MEGFVLNIGYTYVLLVQIWNIYLL